MRAPTNSTTATAGAVDVQACLLRLGWGVVPVPQEHDLGTDLLAAARDSRRFDTGLLVGVQVKTGSSFFDQPHGDGAGKIEGWWYSEARPDHFDYWVKHQAPHLLVLYDIDAKKGYWVHVTPERCVSTGKGVKILVPSDQVLDDTSADALLAVAATKRARISLEGTAFDAAAYPIAPGDRLRYAMLMPRLVAPHQNRGFVPDITPEGAMALLSLLRIHQFQELMDGHVAWPDLNAVPVSRDWRWSFVHAVWQLLTKREVGPLEAIIKVNTRPDWGVCAVSTLAAAHYDQQNVAAARKVVQDAIAQDQAAPVDQAWLQLHEARYALEHGDSAAAATAVDRAIEALATSSDDPSATFLRGLAYRNKLLLGDLKSASADLGETIAAGDNAGAWWRAQQSLWASESAHEELFRDWSGGDDWTLTNDPVINKLLGGIFAAGLAADQSAWQSAQLRLGRFAIMRAGTAAETFSALQSLVRSGKPQAFAMAAKRMVRQGPCVALAMLAPTLLPERVPRSQSAVFLNYWQDFGHYADEDSADAFARAALAALMPHQSATTQRLPWYDANHRVQLLDALCCVLPVVTANVVDATAKAVVSIPDLRAVEVDALGRLVANLIREHPATMSPGMVIELANRFPSARALSISVAELAEQGHAEAKALLRERSAAGDQTLTLVALATGLLAVDEVKALGASLRVQVAHFQRQHRAGASGGDRNAVSRTLALVALKANEVADWQALADYLGDPAISASDKIWALSLLAQHRNSVPEHARVLLAKALPGLAASRHAPRESLTGVRDLAKELAGMLGAALALPDEGRDDQLAAMMLDSSATVRRRALLALSFRTDAFVAAAAVRAAIDPDPGVRVTAAGLVGSLLREGLISDALQVAAKVAASDPGEGVPLAFVEGLGAEAHSRLGDEIEALKQHPSARVRNKAAAVVVKHQANDAPEPDVAAPS